jgi:hypothetical protein
MRFCREAAGRLRMSALARIYLNIVNAILKFNKMKSSVYLCCCDIMMRISHLIQHKPVTSHASSSQIPVSTPASCRSRRRSFQSPRVHDTRRSRCRTDTRAIVTGRSLFAGCRLASSQSLQSELGRRELFFCMSGKIYFLLLEIMIETTTSARQTTCTPTYRLN